MNALGLKGPENFCSCSLLLWECSKRGVNDAGILRGCIDVGVVICDG